MEVTRRPHYINVVSWASDLLQIEMVKFNTDRIRRLFGLECFGRSFLTISFVLLLAISIRSLVFEPFHIPSGSMKDTLLVGDLVLSTKFSYGYNKHSFPFNSVPINGRVMPKTPSYGDVVIFRPPFDTSPTYCFLAQIHRVRQIILFLNILNLGWPSEQVTKQTLFPPLAHIPLTWKYLG